MSKEADYQKTLERLEAVKKHFASKARTDRLANKVCIVTGAGSPAGIGRATAILFAHEGAKALYLSDIFLQGLEDLQAYLKQHYPDVQVHIEKADAADESFVQSVCKEAASKYGSLDVFFANAGKATLSPIKDTTAEQYQDLMRINSLSCFLAIKHASEIMRKQENGGSIILTASVAGLRAGAGGIDYSATKASVINLAHTAASQLYGTQVRVNAVLPGLIESGMTIPVFQYAKQRNTAHRIGQLNPLRRYGLPQEIANAVLFLASDEASYVNGAAIPVDGGLSASLPVVPGRLS